MDDSRDRSIRNIEVSAIRVAKGIEKAVTGQGDPDGLWGGQR